LIENSATKFGIAFNMSYPLELTPMAGVYSTKPVCSMDNSTISGSVMG